MAACWLKKVIIFCLGFFYMEVAMILLFVNLLQPRYVPYSAHVFMHFFPSRDLGKLFYTLFEECLKGILKKDKEMGQWS